MKITSQEISLSSENLDPETTSFDVAVPSGRSVAGNTLWNLFGNCFPVVIAVVCLPVLKRSLGTDLLGIISLAWVLIGYFGLFDLGLSRALTKLVAERIGQRRQSEVPSLIWTSLFLMTAVGMIGSLLTFLITPYLVERLLKVPPSLSHESLGSFYWLGAAVPVVVLTAGLRGVLEAVQHFRLATVIRVPMGIFSYVGPVALLPFTHSLAPIVAVLVLGRILACAAHLWACFHVMPSLRRSFGFHIADVTPLFLFGSWMTVSNVLGPLMVTFDRFLIGSVISIAAVAYYSIPYEVVTKMWLISTALVGVLFPMFSATSFVDRTRLAYLYESGVKYIFAVLLPITLVLVIFAPEGLSVWMGTDFAHNSVPVARLLAVAILINSAAHVPLAHLQSVGRPDVTAKFHLLELPFYLVTLFFLARHWGITGVAVAWLLRVIIDAFLLFWFSFRLLPECRFIVTRLPLMMAGGLVLNLVAASIASLIVKAILVGAVFLLVLPALWLWMFTPAERAPLQFLLQRWKS
ncbi:MAG TPA: flippase [Candidatus Binatia bacterium]|nr:flippase [Candidatus Binatia bacterium]